MSRSVTVPECYEAENSNSHGFESGDWQDIERCLDAHGHAEIPGLITPSQCEEIKACYATDALFRNRIVMSRHNFGRGEYKYFQYPLPSLVQTLRVSAFSKLAPIANRWNERMKQPVRFPADHDEFLRTCHAAGQTRPTPLLLRYAAGDYNCLHQDVYGEHLFPLQIAILLSRLAKTLLAANSC